MDLDLLYYRAQLCQRAYSADAVQVGTEWAVFDTSVPGRVSVAFRGTKSLQQLREDLDCVSVAHDAFPGRVHRGFATAAVGCWADVFELLHAPEGMSQREFHLMGHSEGGDLALGIAWLMVPRSGRLKSVTAFAPARFGNYAWAKAFTESTLPCPDLIIGQHDPIPRLPEGLSWWHCGRVHILGSDGQFYDATCVLPCLPDMREHEIANYCNLIGLARKKGMAA